MSRKSRIILISAVFAYFTNAFGQELEKNLAPIHPQIQFRPDIKPDRVILTPSNRHGDKLTVTWRTSNKANPQQLQLSRTSTDPDFYKKNIIFEAMSQSLVTLEGDSSLYHHVELNDLEPNIKFAYRVGGGNYWSEWFDILPSNSQSIETKLIFLGDAQNDLYSLWSRVLRSAHRRQPDTDLVLHVGDLINHSQNDYEWAEWFFAGNSIFPTIPQIAIPGNHEYIKDADGEKIGFTPFWDPQFNFPKNHPKGFEDRTFYVDHKNIRIICLDSNSEIIEQTPWLEETLASNTQKWTIVMFHHPVLSGAKNRDNEGVLVNWKPLLDKYKVDLVLQGHDHLYARGYNPNSGMEMWDENSGSVYVISVAGRKMYPLEKRDWMQVSAADMATFQLINIKGDKLEYKAYSLDDKLFDAFEIHKVKGQLNKLIDTRQ